MEAAQDRRRRCKSDPPKQTQACRVVAEDFYGRCVFCSIVVMKDTFSSPIEILELTVLERPEERRDAERAEKHGDWNEIRDYAHGRLRRASRNALPTTPIDEPDMAMAARKGVSSPRTAIGTATML